MAIVAEMKREAGPPEADRPGEAPAAVLDLDALNGAVERAIAAHLRSRRAGWQTAVVGVLAAGLIALAGVAYSTLRSDMTAMRAEISGLRTEMQSEIGGLRSEMRAEIADLRTEMRAEIAALRAEMQAEFAQVHAVLLDHTDRLARLETAVGLPRLDGTEADPAGDGRGPAAS